MQSRELALLKISLLLFIRLHGRWALDLLGPSRPAPRQRAGTVTQDLRHVTGYSGAKTDRLRLRGLHGLCRYVSETVFGLLILVVASPKCSRGSGTVNITRDQGSTKEAA